MIDVALAYSGAIAAFKMTVKLVNAGRELSECTEQLSKWYGCFADIQKAEDQARSQTLFEKASQGAESAEKIALDSVIRQKELRKKENDLAFLLDFKYGPGTHKQVVDLRRKIKKEREETVYRKMEAKRAIINNLAITVLSVLIFAAIGGGGYLVGVGAGAW